MIRLKFFQEEWSPQIGLSHQRAGSSSQLYQLEHLSEAICI